MDKCISNIASEVFDLKPTSDGHNWLASLLRKRKIDFTPLDNAFVDITDWTRAQQIHRLDEFASRFCPIHRSFGVAYH